MKIFHHNDNDGYAAAAVIYRSFKRQGLIVEKDDFISVNYNDNVPTADQIQDNDVVVIVDYSFTKATVHNLYEISKKANRQVWWYDHHKSSLEVLDKVIEDRICKDAIIDTNRSGAKIVFDTYGKYERFDMMSEIIKLVDDYDRWVHQYPESMWFNIGSTMEDTHPTSDIWINNPTKIIENGKLIKEYNDAKNSRTVKNNGYEITINGHKCIVLNSPERSSQAFAEYFDEYKFAVIWSFNGKNFTHSIYSQLEDIDCSKIAQYFNPKGGGHKGAAGFVSEKFMFPGGSKFVI